MSKVRVLVGTRKGAFILTSDGKRQKWDVSGPHFAGWEMYHVKGSPADPNRLYASQSSGWFGQMIQRSNDGGKTWEPVGNKFVYDGVPGTHQWYDGTPHPWEFKRVWHLEPSLTDPDTVYAGVEDAALFRTPTAARAGRSFRTARPRLGSALAAGRGRHVPAHDPARSRATRSGSTSPSPPRARSAPTTAARPGRPINQGLHSQYIPDPNAEVGHCVHRIAMHPSRPDVLFMQKHWDVMRSDNAGDSWHEVSGNLPDRLRLRHRRARARAGNHLRGPDQERLASTFPPDGKLRVYRSRTGGNEWEPLTKGLPQQDCYVNVLRDAMAVDSLDSCGVYFGTTGGQVYASADAGDNWAPIVRDLPAVLSVEVQTLRMIRVSCFRRICGRWRESAAKCSWSRGSGDAAVGPRRARGALSRCCAGRFAITSRSSAGRSCASSPARRICRTNRRTLLCRMQ